MRSGQVIGARLEKDLEEVSRITWRKQNDGATQKFLWLVAFSHQKVSENQKTTTTKNHYQVDQGPVNSRNSLDGGKIQKMGTSPNKGVALGGMDRIHRKSGWIKVSRTVCISVDGDDGHS